MSPDRTPSSSSPPRIIDRAAVVECARSWVETPFSHQGRVKGHRVDCVGLILGVGEELGLLSITPRQLRPFSGYARTPNPRMMGEGIRRFLSPNPTPRGDAPPDGSIGWLEWREDLPMHLAIIATYRDRRTLIHAYQNAGKCVEHGFVAEWPGRIVSWWDFPPLGGTDGAAPTVVRGRGR